MVNNVLKGIGVIAVVFIALVIGINFVNTGRIGLPEGTTETEPVQTAVVGTARHPTLTTFIPNAITGANIGDGTNDHAYIIELKEAFAGSSFSEIRSAYASDPGDVCEDRAGWDDTTPDSSGEASGETYDVGQKVLIYVAPASEYPIVYLYEVAEPDFQATTTQLKLPVFTPAAAWAETYQTETGAIYTASSNYDLSTEGGDTEDQIQWTIRSTTADSVLGWFVKDPIYDSTRYKNYISYFYVSSNTSTLMATDSDDAWDDGTTFTYFFDVSHNMVSPEDWGCPSYLNVVSGTPVGINEDADANDGFISGMMTWSVISADSSMTSGLEANDWDQEFGLGTPTGDVTELIKIQA